MEAEHVKAAAFRDPETGHVTEGDYHVDAELNSPRADRLRSEGYEDGGAVIEKMMFQLGEAFHDAEGFVTSTGRFVSRHEALTVAKAAEQRIGGRVDRKTWLNSEDLEHDDRYMPPAEQLCSA